MLLNVADTDAAVEEVENSARFLNGCVSAFRVGNDAIILVYTADDVPTLTHHRLEKMVMAGAAASNLLTPAT